MKQIIRDMLSDIQSDRTDAIYRAVALMDQRKAEVAAALTTWQFARVDELCREDYAGRIEQAALAMTDQDGATFTVVVDGAGQASVIGNLTGGVKYGVDFLIDVCWARVEGRRARRLAGMARN